VPDGGALPQHASRRSRRSSSPQPARRVDRCARAQALFVSLPRRRGDRCCHRGARASASCSAFERVDESEIVVTLDCRRKPPCAHRQNANVGGRELGLRCSRSHDAADLPLRPPRGERCNGCAGPRRIIERLRATDQFAGIDAQSVCDRPSTVTLAETAARLCRISADRALRLHHHLCAFYHVADFFPYELSAALIVCSVSQSDDRWGCFLMRSRVAKRSVVINDHKTSISLEDEFWEGLKVIAKLRVTNLSALVTTIDSQREHANLSSAIRIFVLNFYRNQVPDSTGEALHEIVRSPPTMHS
jgi:predicted DNA-binding ribbon-helix-helix protein